MGLTLGLDIGTTTLSVVLLDTSSGELVARRTVANTASRHPAHGRAELDMAALRALLMQTLAETVALAAARRGAVRGVGVTGQMHGVALLRPDATPIAPAITWQDRRTEETVPGTSQTWLQRFMEQAGGEAAFARMGCLPASGYLGPTLFWLRQHGQLPEPPAVACFIPDAAVAFLTGRVPPTEPTDGGSSGLFDIVAGDWDWALMERLGLPQALFPPAGQPGDLAGTLLPDVAAATGLPAGTPVFVAMGDNQASFLGSVQDAAQSIALNIGTGAQISAAVAGFHPLPGLDTRYFHSGRYLLVGAGLFGGRSYAYLQAFFQQVGRAFFGQQDDAALYDTMNRLAADVPPGAEGVRCVPLFTGTRRDPTLRAGFSGLSPDTFTPGHLTRALLEGMAEIFHDFYRQMQPLVGQRTRLVGSGNGIRRNPLLARILAARFGLPLHIPAHTEEAATGAALLAAVGAGALPNLDAATRLLRYAEVALP